MHWCRSTNVSTTVLSYILVFIMLLSETGVVIPVVGAQSTSSTVAAPVTSTTTIQAQPDSTQLSSKGSQAGCDHYRNGYLGLALCVNYYDDSNNGEKIECRR